MLLDAIACAFYGINPSSYRRKSRKFNQHDLLRLILGTAVESRVGRRLELIMDCPEWTSFDALKMDILSNVSMKNSPKIRIILDMYCYDQRMMAVGLANVIIKVFEVFAGNSSTILPLGTRPTTKSIRLRGDANYPMITKSFLDRYEGISPQEAIGNVNFIRKDSVEKVLSSPSREPQQGSEIRVLEMLPDVTPLISPGKGKLQVRPFTAARFVAKEKNGRSLQSLFGDGKIISIAAASAENLGLILYQRISDFEWCFESLDESTTNMLCNPMVIRVRGQEVLLCRYIEHL